MIRNRARYEELRGAVHITWLRGLSVDDAIAIGEALLRSDLMRFVRPAEERPMALARAVRAGRTKPGSG